VNDRELNLCLVGTPATIGALRSWAEKEFGLSADQPWRTITPLTRDPIPAANENLFFIGDAARVVEPFTGEGIYYALRSGELAADAILKIIRAQDRQSALREFAKSHRAMYRGRLWINQLARAAVLSPRIASALLPIARVAPFVLPSLTRKIVSSR
jgi:flavin-dependent dehydrogenase